MVLPPLNGFDLLATAVVVADAELRLRYLNPAAENLFEISNLNRPAQPLDQLFRGAERLAATARQAVANGLTYVEHELHLQVGERVALDLDCSVTPLAGGLLFEFKPISQQLRVAREERLLQEQQGNREMIRNLAHEIKNPLGGIRGAAQLLENELPRTELTEYTQVIIKEADRLQSLLDRLLAPSRGTQLHNVNVHEVLEQVRSLILAEYPRDLEIRRDYDVSLPELRGDAQQLTQALLNIVRNAAQALGGAGSIELRSRAASKVTLAKKRYRLALRLQIIDNGPGIAPDMLEKIFYPLVSGRDSGMGLGLTIAQHYVMQQQGTIEVESRPGRTCFNIMLPVITTHM